MFTKKGKTCGDIENWTNLTWFIFWILCYGKQFVSKLMMITAPTCRSLELIRGRKTRNELAQHELSRNVCILQKWTDQQLVYLWDSWPTPPPLVFVVHLISKGLKSLPEELFFWLSEELCNFILWSSQWTGCGQGEKKTSKYYHE